MRMTTCEVVKREKNGFRPQLAAESSYKEVQKSMFASASSRCIHADIRKN